MSAFASSRERAKMVGMDFTPFFRKSEQGVQTSFLVRLDFTKVCLQLTPEADVN